MSASLKAKNISPDLIITSPAVRTTTTALIFCRALDYDPSGIFFKEKLYHSSYQAYLEVIRKIDAHYSNVFIFGHNPLVSDCAMALVPSITEEMSTCAITGIMNPQWSDFKPGAGKLVYYDFPKNHD
jgi:phosphohistidine phosphatase